LIFLEKQSKGTTHLIISYSAVKMATCEEVDDIDVYLDKRRGDGNYPQNK
jgi:hypothetical protein